MIAVHARSAADFASSLALDAVPRGDCFGLVVRGLTTTNISGVVVTPNRRPEPARHSLVDLTMQHAVSRYDALLRRLAD